VISHEVLLFPARLAKEQRAQGGKCFQQTTNKEGNGASIGTKSPTSQTSKTSKTSKTSQTSQTSPTSQTSQTSKTS
jgi:hypothetical protein